MKCITFNRQRCEFCVSHFDTFFVIALVDVRFNSQALSGCGAANQVDHNLSADQRSPTPIGGDVAEHAALNLVPFAGARLDMTNLDGYPLVSCGSIAGCIPLASADHRRALTDFMP
jgi:hypothetical protein